MASKQSRRSVSVCKETYEALQKKALEDGTSCSGIVEKLVRPYLGLDQSPPVIKPGPVPKEPKPAKLTGTVSLQPVPAPTPKLEKPVAEPRRSLKPLREIENKSDPILGDDVASKIFTF